MDGMLSVTGEQKQPEPLQIAGSGSKSLAVAMSLPDCLGSAGIPPSIFLSAAGPEVCFSDGILGERIVRDNDGNQIANVTLAVKIDDTLFFSLSIHEKKDWHIRFKLQEGVKRTFTWVVEDGELDPDRLPLRPWIDVVDDKVDFGEVTDEKLDKPEPFRVGNRGTGKLRVDGIRDLPSVFTVVTTLPINIDPGRSATIEIKPTSKPSVAIESTCTVQSNDSLTGHNNQITLKASPPPAPTLPTIDRFIPESLQQGENKPDFEVHGSNLNKMKLLRFYREEKWDWIQATNMSVSDDGSIFKASVAVKADAPADNRYTLKLLRGDGDPDPTKCATCATPFSVTPAQPEDLTMTPNHGCLGTKLTNVTLGGKNLSNVDQVSFEPTGNITATITTKGPSEIVLNLEIKEDASIGEYDLTLAPSGSKFLKAFRVCAATVYSIEPNWGIRGTTLPAFITVQGLSNVEGPIKFRQEGKTEDAPGISASTAHFGDEVPAIPVNAEVMKLAVDNEGRHLLALLADANGSGPAVRRYEFPQYKFCNQLSLGREKLEDCILSPTGGHFVTVHAGSPPLVVLWDATNGQTQNVIDRCKKAAILGMGEITRVSVAFSPDGKFLAVGAIEGYRKEVVPNQFGGLFGQAETPAVWLYRLTLYLLDIGNGTVANYVPLAQHVATPSSGGDIACSLVFSPDSSCLAVSLRDRNWNASQPDSGSWHAELRSIPSLQPIVPSLSQPGVPFSVGDIEIERLAFSGPLLAARAGNSQWKIWEVATGVEVATMTDATDLVFSPNGAWLAVVRGLGSFPIVSFDWEVRIFHTRGLLDNTSISPSGSKSYPKDQPVTHMVFSPDGGYLLVIHDDSAEVLEQDHWLEEHVLMGRHLPKAGFIGPAASPGTLKAALDIKNLQPGIAFSPDKRYLVAATSSGVRTWLVTETKRYDSPIMPLTSFSFPVLITIGANASPGKYTFRLRSSEGVGFNENVTFTVE